MAEMDAAQVRDVYNAGYEDGMVHIRNLIRSGFGLPYILSYIEEYTKTGQYAQTED